MNIEAESAIADYESLNSHGNGKTVSVPAHMPLISAVNGLKSILEAVLFVAGEPLTLDRLVTVLEGSSRAEVRDAMNVHLTHQPTKVSKSRIKRLRGLSRPQFRLRVGDWRVLFRRDGTVIAVTKVAPRGSAYD